MTDSVVVPVLRNDRSGTDSLYMPPSAISPEASRLDRTIWQAIDALLGRALQLKPENRFASGSEWMAAWDSVNDLIRRPPQQSPLDRFRGACSVSLLLTQLQECQPGDDREMQPYATAIGSTL